MIAVEKAYFTPEGIEKYKEKLEEREEEINQLQSRLSELADSGGDDWHDNFSFEEQQRQIQMKTRQLKKDRAVLSRAKVIEKPENPDEVCIGATIDLIRNGNEETWEIGGYDESSPEDRIAAYNTPIGSKLMHHEEGDTLQFNGQRIRVVSIS